MIKAFSITRENDYNSETAIVLDKEDLSIDDDALLRVCAAIWPGTLNEDYGYFALPVNTSKVFVANSIQREEDCWGWKVKFVAEAEQYTIESIYSQGQANTEDHARELMTEAYLDALSELRGE